MYDNPWADIGHGTSVGDLAARRVDPTHPWDIYWARDISGRNLLVFRHYSDAGVTQALPALSGFEVSTSDGLPGGKSALVLTLLKLEDRDVFHHLCIDIIEVTRGAVTEALALKLAIQRVWRWHELLSGIHGGLSLQAEQGLFGELIAFELLLNRLSTAAVLAAWKGPLGGAQDFLTGALALEIKTRQPGRSYVTITSADQLTAPAALHLLLLVMEVTPDEQGHENALRLHDVASRILERIKDDDPGLCGQFRSLMAVAGCRDLGESLTNVWKLTSTTAWNVDPGFPALMSSAIPEPVSEVRYRLNLDGCQSFKTDLHEKLDNLIGVSQ